MLGCQFGEKTGLIYGMRHRLLHIYMLSCLDCLSGDHCVGVVCSSDHNRIGILEHFIEHHAVVIVPLGVRIAVKYRLCIIPVNIAKADDVLRLEFAEYCRTASSDSYAEDVELVARGCRMTMYLTEDSARGDGQSEGCRRTGLDERPSRHFFSHKI